MEPLMFRTEPRPVPATEAPLAAYLACAIADIAEDCFVPTGGHGSTRPFKGEGSRGVYSVHMG